MQSFGSNYEASVSSSRTEEVLHAFDRKHETNFTGNMYAKYKWHSTIAYSPEKHKYMMGKVLQASPDVENWINEHHNLLWARNKFSCEIKCDYINNNLVESWNSWIKEHKDLHVHCMPDAIREKL